ncbi:hypothetical protein QYF50_00795 [Paenibacillus vini]|uniref:hypothetical protein n=1 Tax=Paenibacillus vini TaxID=1476024 RepID=UPI0025B6CAE0|nr:hypothetical protein [Paenibacillus vini]MDN4066414.1 hypothetical protein [Paenibacillus vini]
MSEQLLHQILQKLDHIEAEQSSMKSDINSMKSDMNSMKSDMQTMKADILGLKETQELMQVQLGETNAIVRAIRDRQDETDAKLDALSMDVHKLHGELTSVKATQDRHEKILDKLATRSIEQEADIHQLKLAR